MLFQAAFQFFASVQTELAVFVLAICAHQLLFGKHGLAAGSRKKASSKQCPPTATTETSPSAGNAANLAQSVKQLSKTGAGRKQLTACICDAVEASTQEDASVMLSEALKTLGKAADVSILAAVRDAARETGISLGPRLGEPILRSYFSLGMYSDFNQVLGDVKQAGPLKPSVAALVLRAAVAAEDLSGALAQLPDVASALQEDGPTPSVAPQGAVQQLAKLAVKKAQLPALLNGFKAAAPRLAPTALEVALATAGEARAVEEVEEIGRSAGVELTATAFTSLLRAAGSGERARRLFQEASGSAALTPELLAAAALAAATHRDETLAQAVLAKLPEKPTQEVAVGVLRMYSEGLLKGSIIDLWEKQLAGSAVLSDVRVAKLVADAAFKCQRTDALGRLLSAEPVGSGHAALVKAFGAEGRAKDARKVFEACPEKSTVLYNTLLDICVDGRDLEAAEHIMAQAVAEGMADAVTYNTMIKKHLQRGDFKAARAAIETMRTAGGSLAPNCVTFNEFIDAAIRTGTKPAWDLVEEMKACGLKPNGVTCSILLKGVQQSSAPGDVERALALMETLEEPMDEVLVSSVCEACIRAGRADLLKRALRRIRGGATTVAVMGAHTFGSLIRAHGFLGDVSGAWTAWKEMRSLSVIPTSTTIGCMVEALASNGNPEAAHRLVQELSGDEQTRPLLNATIYGSILKGFSHQKHFAKVWSVYKEVLAIGLEISLATCNTLLDACARSGELERIPTLLQDMARRGIEANVVTYSTVLKAYCADGRLNMAFQVLEEMKASKNMQPDEIAYNTLIDGCARSCWYDRGVALLREMEQRGVTPSVYTLSVLAKLASRCRRPKQAEQLCGEVARKHNIRLNVHAHNNLVAAWTQQGYMREGFEAFERMLHDGVSPDVRTYTLMLRGCVAAGDAESAAGLLRAATGLRGMPVRISMFSQKLQLRGGLPYDLVDEVLDGIATKCYDGRLAQQLRWDLKGAAGGSVQQPRGGRTGSR